MNDEKMKSLCLYLSLSPKQQVLYVLYNIISGIITISVGDKNKLSKYKNIVRKLLASDLKWGSRKKILWKMRHLVPTIVQNYLNHVKRTGVNSEEEI